MFRCRYRQAFKTFSTIDLMYIIFGLEIYQLLQQSVIRLIGFARLSDLFQNSFCFSDSSLQIRLKHRFPFLISRGCFLKIHLHRKR